MKRLVVFLILLLSFSLTGWSQIYMIESFELKASDGGYGVYTDIDVESFPEIYFDMDTSVPSQRTRMELNYDEVETFAANLLNAMDNFDEWKLNARANSMALLTKKMPIAFNPQDIFFTREGAWYQSENTELSVIFFVDSNGFCYAILESDILSCTETIAKSWGTSSYKGVDGRWNVGYSWSRQDLTRFGDRGSLVFTSKAEASEFINHLRNVVAWKKNNGEMNDLLPKMKHKNK